MKILQVIHQPQNRGAETFACQLSNHLEKKGHQVVMVSIYSGTANLPYKGEIISLGALPGKSLVDRKAWKRLAGIIKDFKPDVIQTNSGDTLKYAVLSKITFRWKIPLISRNASEVGRYLNTKTQKSINSFFYKNVNHIISVSKASEKDIIKNFPFLKGKTEVIGVGLENSPFDSEFQFPLKNKKNIIHVGGFSFEKNHSGILRIFKKVISAYPNVHLHLVGDGKLKPEIENKVHTMELQESITFHGYQSNPLDLINAADVLILPSIIEGLPGVLLEAMYCKTPVVAYNVGGISEILSEETGYLIEMDDEDSFTNAICEIFAGSFPNEKLLNAEQLVQNNFMNEQLASQFIASYNKLLIPKPIPTLII